MKENKIVVATKANIRLDIYLSKNISDFSRQLISANIKNGNVLLNGKKTKPSHTIKEGDQIEYKILYNLF